MVNGVTREDQGMYQCVARRAEGDTAQAAAELQLGGNIIKLNSNIIFIINLKVELARCQSYGKARSQH